MLGDLYSRHRCLESLKRNLKEGEFLAHMLVMGCYLPGSSAGDGSLSRGPHASAGTLRTLCF